MRNKVKPLQAITARKIVDAESSPSLSFLMYVAIFLYCIKKAYNISVFLSMIITGYSLPSNCYNA